MPAVGVRGRAPDGGEHIVRFTPSGAVSARPGAPYVEQVRITVEDGSGQVLHTVIVSEVTLARAVQRLFADKIRDAWQRFHATDGKPGQAGQTGQPKPTEKTKSQAQQQRPRAVGLDWGNVVSFGLWVFEGAIPEPLRRGAEVLRTALAAPTPPAPPPTTPSR